MSTIDNTTIQNVRTELESIEAQLADPKVYASPDSGKLVNRQRELIDKLALFENVQKTEEDLNTASEMLNDPEMKEFAAEEVANLTKQLQTLENDVKVALMSKTLLSKFVQGLVAMKAVFLPVIYSACMPDFAKITI